MINDAIDVRKQGDCGPGRIEIFGKLPLAHGIVQPQGDPVVALYGVVLTLTTKITHLVSKLALVKQDFIDATGFRVQCELMKQMNQKISHTAQRVFLVLALTGLRHFVERLLKTVEHGLYQIGLIIEVPINGASRHTGKRRNICQRGAGDASLIKSLLSSLQNLAASDLSFLFGATNHGNKTSKNSPQACVWRQTWRYDRAAFVSPCPELAAGTVNSGRMRTAGVYKQPRM
ncbi:hypothetical protein ALQ15_111794 [Pseudomonas syringae pv. actinidiae]|uniref:Uncharacterized protein n=1 Tax=Pseudomonas syringae pv. actinidiae TaxID=103796 RepID=A0A7Z6U8F7_PSESF|nr:hypothetical protein ALQ15_111794 [Pseudomonas syringae pv. actinidiae]